MLNILLILFGLMPIFALNAQHVANIRVTQESDNVVIIYDILSNNLGQTFDIKVECSADDGKTFSILPKTLTGDLKGIKVGTDKRIVWDVLSERQELAGDRFVFQLVLAENYAGNSGTFTDAKDGHFYKWVKIGTQIWMAENLKATIYNDGSSIPNVTDNKAWKKLKQGAYCWYNNDDSNENIYGALYNWYAVNTGKLAPNGWHVPTDAEWTTLTTFLGGETVAGGKLIETGTTHWQSPITGATNEFGFTALPAGYRSRSGTFCSIGSFGIWWCSSEDGAFSSWRQSMHYVSSNVRWNYHIFKDYGFSVHCVKD